MVLLHLACLAHRLGLLDRLLQWGLLVRVIHAVRLNQSHLLVPLRRLVLLDLRCCLARLLDLLHRLGQWGRQRSTLHRSRLLRLSGQWLRSGRKCQSARLDQ